MRDGTKPYRLLSDEPLREGDVAGGIGVLSIENEGVQLVTIDRDEDGVAMLSDQEFAEGLRRIVANRRNNRKRRSQRKDLTKGEARP